MKTPKVIYCTFEFEKKAKLKAAPRKTKIFCGISENSKQNFWQSLHSLGSKKSRRFTCHAHRRTKVGVDMIA